MKNQVLIGGALALGMLSVPAQAATIVQGFTVSAGNWVNGGPAPYGIEANPTIIGSITVDNTKTDKTAFLAINYKTGSRIWTLADIFSGNLTFDSLGKVVQFSFQDSGGRNYFYSNNTVGIGEGRAFQFCNGCVSLTEAVAAVPEPATWTLMLLGFGFVGGAMRSRKRQKVTVSYA